MLCASLRVLTQQLPVGAPALGLLRDSRAGDPPVAGWDALVHRQNSRVAGEELLSGVEQRLRHHLVWSHFQLRISGRSWPC